MIVADRLGVGPDDVEVLHSDTAIAPLGLDTYGSRSLAVGGVAIAHGVRQGASTRPGTIAAHQLEAAEDDLEFAGGAFTVQGLARPRRCRWRRSPSRPSPPTTCPTAWSPTSRRRSPTTRPTSRGPFGTHICVVEVDEETGARRRCCSTSPSTTAATRSTR